MASRSDQIYSATYSNVPVFEFVTEEGPIMRRKSDSWINATHILKIAKFPKARRTRVLEKDVQTGIHEKVQGGYGKYQGTYVPLDLGAEIAKTFGVYEVLKPIFDFQYIEGRSETPPPAPKHNHASASNVAKKLQQQKNHKHEFETQDPQKRMRMPNYDGEDSTPKKRGRPKRIALTGAGKPDLLYSKTVPIQSGPSMGTFSARQESSFSQAQHLPLLMRQDTELDALLAMASNMNVKREDLEAESSDDDNETAAGRTRSDNFNYKDTDDDEFMSGRELFGSRESFGAMVQMHNKGARHMNLHNIPKILSLNGSVSDAYGLMQYHHQHLPQITSKSLRGDPKSVEYFNTLLNYLLEDDQHNNVDKNGRLSPLSLPEKILNPPQPMSKININQPIDNDGNTIFHWACSMAHLPMIEFLLSIFSKFIDSDVKNFRGETPLMFLVQFNNCFQMGNFPGIFDLLFDSVLAVDNYGRTVLHHIAIACTASKKEIALRPSNDNETRAKKERFAKYYMENVFSRIVSSDFQLSQGNQDRGTEDKKQVISKFINHQDNEGNTAFHVAAYNLSKRCIKIFILYHKYIDFNLRNYVNYTVEDYLASHNYVLRLESNENGDSIIATQDDSKQPVLFPAEHTQSFETQLHNTKMAMTLLNKTANLITEKLTEYSYAIDKELSNKDERLHSLYRYFKIIGLEKFKSQKGVLQLFNLDYLLEEIEKDFLTDDENSQETKKSELLLVDAPRDKMIQEEINRLRNDMCFEELTVKESLQKSFSKYANLKEEIQRKHLKELEQQHLTDTSQLPETVSTLELAKQLQLGIIKRLELAHKLYSEEVKVPLSLQHPDEFKENREDTDGDTTSTTTEQSEGDKSEALKSIIVNFPHNDKLYKYCKLIALSCGMSFAEVENSIDLIEQSLSKSNSHGAVQ